MPQNDGLLYGLTDEGFIAPTYEQWRTWVVKQARKRFGQNIRTESRTVVGWFVDRLSWGLYVAIDGIAGSFSSHFYSTAKGIALDKLLDVFAFKRLGALPSRAELVLYGDPGTIVTLDRIVAVEDTGLSFTLDAERTLGPKVRVIEITEVGAPGNWALDVNGDAYVYPQGVDQTAYDVAAGLAAAIGDQPTYAAAVLDTRTSYAVVLDSKGPDLAVLLTPPASGDGTVYAAARGDFTAIKNGPIQGFAGTITKIQTPITGWIGATNQLDATVGRDTETDEEYRARWDNERFGPGKGTRKAMLAAFAATQELREKVKAIDIVDIKQKYFIVVILAPELSNDEIAQIIWDTHALGTVTAGLDSGVALDEEGAEQIVKFSRATPLYVWMKVTVTKGEKFPTLGDPTVAIAQEIKVWGAGGKSVAIPGVAYPGLTMGDDVERFQIGRAINNAVPGVKGATIRIATTPGDLDPEPPDIDFLDADLVVDDVSAAIFDSGKIKVTIA